MSKNWSSRVNITELTVKVFESCGMTDKQAFEFIRSVERKYNVDGYITQWWAHKTNHERRIRCEDLKPALIKMKENGYSTKKIGKMTGIGGKKIYAITHDKLKSLKASEYKKVKRYIEKEFCNKNQ